MPGADKILALQMQKSILTILVAAVALAGLFVFATDRIDRGRFNDSVEHVLLRKIGHQVLLQSGDSSSRVLPVQQISNNEFRIPFESDFSFTPDSLKATVQNIFFEGGIHEDYVVNILDCKNREVVYAYAVFNKGEKNIVPCSGRVQPKNCYYISIQFKPSKAGLGKPGYIVGISALMMLIFLSLIPFYRKRKPSVNIEVLPEPKAADIKVGRFMFDSREGELTLDDSAIALSEKECKLLSILITNLNQLVAREFLQKEIWENEGVIVGRSLDMFVSKLRRKLEADPSVKIVNIHGKGYRLEA